jgi:hypothetical protein
MTTAAELADLAEIFQEAVGIQAMVSPAFAQRIEACFTEDEIEKLTKLSDAFNAVAEASPHLAAAMQGNDEEFMAEIAPHAVKMFEAITAVMNKGISDEELGELMPPEAHTEEVAQAYEAHGAPTLARICRTPAP